LVDRELTDRAFKILVVDSDHDTRADLRKQLQASHYDVIAAESGSETDRLISAVRPDLILLNLRGTLPDFLDLPVRLKNNPVTSHIPLILLSETHQPLEIKSIAETGVVDFLVAPHSPGELLARVRMALNEPYARNEYRIRFRQFQFGILDRVASQIRKRITVVSGLAELMEKRIHSQDEKGRLVCLRGVLQSTEEIKDLVDDFERMFGADGLSEEIDVGGLIRSEIARFRSSLKHKYQNVIFNPPAENGIRVAGNRPFLSAAVGQMLVTGRRLANEGVPIGIHVVRESNTVRISIEHGPPAGDGMRDGRVGEMRDWKSADAAGIAEMPVGIAIAGSIIEHHAGRLLVGKTGSEGWECRVELPANGPPSEGASPGMDSD
jgi:DNA-binding response OmpR family regulator